MAELRVAETGDQRLEVGNVEQLGRFAADLEFPLIVAPDVAHQRESEVGH